jgi:tRNA(Ile)-lysidine synthase
MTARSADEGPMEPAEIAALFAPLARSARIGVAVSGGPDSSALLVLLDRWAKTLPAPPTLHVLTVDHGLRASAHAEAEAVAVLASSLGHPASLLVWRHEGEPPQSGIQAAARDARYRLLADEARRLSLDAVALGHTLDDQAETLLIRLARGSGVWGLAGMAAERTAHGVRFVRPLLSIPKSRLVAILDKAGIPFVDDPANASDRFLRARIRRMMPDLAAIGLDADRLAGTAHRLARAASALQTMVDALFHAAVTDHGGVFEIEAARLREAPEEIALRLVATLVRTIRHDAYLPRAAPLEAWTEAFRAGAATARRATMAGVVLDPRRDRVWIYAEAGRTGFREHDLQGPGTAIWDSRFQISLSGDVPQGLTIGSAQGDERRRDLPKAAAASLPAVRWQGTALAIGQHTLAGRTFALDLIPLGAIGPGEKAWDD